MESALEEVILSTVYSKECVRKWRLQGPDIIDKWGLERAVEQVVVEEEERIGFVWGVQLLLSVEGEGEQEFGDNIKHTRFMGGWERNSQK